MTASTTNSTSYFMAPFIWLADCIQAIFESIYYILASMFFNTAESVSKNETEQDVEDFSLQMNQMNSDSATCHSLNLFSKKVQTEDDAECDAPCCFTH